MLPCCTAAVVPGEKSIFTAEGVAVAVGGAGWVEVDVSVGGSGVGELRAAGSVGVCNGVDVAASIPGRLQLTSRTITIARVKTMVSFLFGV